MKTVTKTLAIAVALALFTTACGSDQSELAGNDNAANEQAEDVATTEEPEADDQPPEGFRRFTFTFSPEDVIADIYGGDLSTFEVRSASGSETTVVGFLDANGTIDIPIEVAKGTIGVEAEFPDDAFCWWSGFYTSIDSSRTVTVEVELDEVCA